MRLKKRKQNVCLRNSKGNRAVHHKTTGFQQDPPTFWKSVCFPLPSTCTTAPCFNSALGKSNMFFLRLGLITSHPALGISNMYVFLLLALVTGFPLFILAPWYFPAWHQSLWLHLCPFLTRSPVTDYPALPLVRCFPTLSIGYVFSRA